MTDEWVTAVQRRALERALVDDVDARRYFALAGSLEAVHDEDTAEPNARGQEGGVDGVLSAALLSLAVVRSLDTTPRVSPTTDPWTPGTDTARPVVERGARLALRWFDVSADRVATRAGLPAAVLTGSDGHN
jgi:hypothetical protein